MFLNLIKKWRKKRRDRIYEGPCIDGGTRISNDIEAPKEITQDYLVAERARELMWEAHRRTDLIRYGLYDTQAYLWPYKGGDSFAGQAFPSYKLIFPIPPTELAANDLLVQNPGY